MMTRLKMELRRTVELNIPDQSEFLIAKEDEK